jgi:hypothetical protein
LMTRAAALLVVAISLFCLISAASASAAASYVFEPTLSLTGGCTTSPLDEVPDPGPCPGTPGVDHPSASFKNPSVTTDAYGDLYVISGAEGAKKVEIFDANGFFVGEFADPGDPSSIAVDSKGNVYVFDQSVEGLRKVRRFPPTAYDPPKGEFKYGNPPVVVVDEKTFGFLGFVSSIAVDTSDLLYLDYVQAVSIFKSAEAGNELLKNEAISGLVRSSSIAVDSVHKKIYLSDKVPGSSVVRVFESEPPYAELKEEEISGTPEGNFKADEGFIQVDVDDSPGHVFVADFTARKVYEFKEDGSLLATIAHSFEGVPNGEIAVDDGPFSPHPQKEGWLFVPSVPAPSLGHIYAFEPHEEGSPIVESTSVDEITEAEATLRATINPSGLETTYRLEYIPQQQFEEEEGKSFEEGNAVIAGQGTLPKGAEGLAVSAPATGLEPSTTYRYRVFAENTEGEDAKERTFKTFPPEEEVGSCENDVFRFGLSALLPDCRAYELVTPPSTNGRQPSGGFFGYTFPPSRASSDGNRVSFLIEGGILPGFESAGAFNGDPYLATRGSEGWNTQSTGPSGKEAVGPIQRGLSPDQVYSFWQDLEGSMHIRYPDGHSELVGRGSLGADPNISAERALITEGAGHIIFATNPSTAIELEPNAGPAGTATVYDRSAAGPTQVVSLLPGNEPQKAGENATYLGASEEGEGVAFEIKGTIYLRLHDEETFEVAGPGAKFAGVADEGKRVFYVAGGDLFAFDAEAEETIGFSSSGNITPVNVATGGTRAYFVSPSVLTGELNPEGEEAEVGEENLYLSEEGAISFVGIVTERDVDGETLPSGQQVGGLGLWLEAIKRPAVDPSRTTPAGATLLFESRANLTGFESEGFAQIFRYDATEHRLDCLSCSPTEAPPTSDASLQSIQAEQFSPEPAGSLLKIANQSPDGKRAFFQTAEPLVARDIDEQLDVYEWEEEKVGGCETEGGCVYLISGAHSASPDYLWAVSASGDDVFFRTSDILLPRDVESTLSLYDARVEGGFAESRAGVPCTGTDTCQLGPTPSPSLPQPVTSASGTYGKLPSGPKCPKGKHAVKRKGKTTCVRKHPRHKHRRTGSGGKGGAK